MSYIESRLHARQTLRRSCSGTPKEEIRAALRDFRFQLGNPASRKRTASPASFWIKAGLRKGAKVAVTEKTAPLPPAQLQENMASSPLLPRRYLVACPKDFLEEQTTVQITAATPHRLYDLGIVVSDRSLFLRLC
jgi:hypothetical protein